MEKDKLDIELGTYTWDPQTENGFCSQIWYPDSSSVLDIDWIANTNMANSIAAISTDALNTFQLNNKLPSELNNELNRARQLIESIDYDIQYYRGAPGLMNQIQDRITAYLQGCK